MKLAGTYTFEAPQQTVWEALRNPTVLTSILPGCEKLEEVGDNQFEGQLDIRVGPVQGKFQGKIEMLDLVAPDSFRLKINGQGTTGFVNASAKVDLEAAGDSTLIHYDSDAQVGGRIAGVGQRLLDSSARSIVQQSLDGFHELVRVASPGPAEGGEPAVNVAQAAAEYRAPTQAEFAAKVAKDVAKDVVPRPLLIGGAILVALIILYLLFS
jgi:carbon monoxide dehydrogenase subunit G